MASSLQFLMRLVIVLPWLLLATAAEADYEAAREAHAGGDYARALAELVPAADRDARPIHTHWSVHHARGWYPYGRYPYAWYPYGWYHYGYTFGYPAYPYSSFHFGLTFVR